MFVYAQQLMTKDFAVIGSDENISKALSLLDETDGVVVMDGEKYEGIITKKDIVRAKIPPEAKVKRFARHAPRISPSTPINEIARLMLESDIYHLPVFDDGKIVGMVRDDDILRYIVEQEIGEQPISNYMSSSPLFVSPNDNIGKVIKIFREENISRLPVVKDGEIVGIITVGDVLDRVLHPEEKPEYGEFIAEKKRYLKIPVKGIMTEEPVIMSPDAKVKDVIEEMLENGFGGMIIGEGKKLVGIVTKKDLLEPIASYGEEDKIFIQIGGEIDRIENFDKDEAMLYLKEFVRKHEEFLENGYLYAYLKQHKEKRHGLPLIYCKIRLSSPKGFFIAADSGWGFRQAMKKAIEAVEKQIEREKERT